MGSRESRASGKRVDAITGWECPSAISPTIQSSSTNAIVDSECTVLLPHPDPPISSIFLQPHSRRPRLVVRETTLNLRPPDSTESAQALGIFSTVQLKHSTWDEKICGGKLLTTMNHHTGSMSSEGPPPPPLQAPKTVYDARVYLIHERTSFVRAHYTRPPSTYRFTVYVYIYDLTDGMLAKHGPKLIEIQTPGAYHSAIVCYGMEFYFEGGIAIAGAGKTRIGKKYKALRLGCTSVSFHDFLAWVRAQERDTYQIHDYNIRLHNCHHFTHKAAEFLLGKPNLVPSYLFSTTENIFKTERGAALCEAMSVVIKGAQYLTAQQQLDRVIKLQSGLNRLLRSLVSCQVPQLPPKVVVIFQVDDEKTCKATLEGIQPYVEQLIDDKLVKPCAKNILSCLTIELSRGFDSVDSSAAEAFVDVIAEALLRNSITFWGPLLNALRVAILHQMVLATVVFHPKMLSILIFGSREFLRLLPDGKLNLLRVICNLACGSHGAILLSDPRFLSTWVSLVGMGLMEPHSAIVYTASCLSVNIAISEVTWIIPSMNNQILRYASRSRILSLMTIVLYNLSFRSVDELPEPSFNMLLTCLLWFMTFNTSVLKLVMRHSFHPSFAKLRQRAQTDESRALITIMERLERTYD